MEGIGANKWMSTTTLVQTSLAGWLACCLTDSLGWLAGWLGAAGKQAPRGQPMQCPTCGQLGRRAAVRPSALGRYGLHDGARARWAG